MKKVLLGTTAMASVGLLAGQASAAEPIQLSIGGYHNWAVFLADNDTDAPSTASPIGAPGFNKGDHDIKFDGELQIKGKTVLDNGLEVGVRIEIEGETQGDQLDENYAYISGSFGEFRVGNDDPASYTLSTAAPYLNYIFATNSPTVFTNGLSQYFYNTGRTFLGAGYATFATFPNQVGDDRTLFYYSPVFNGFQFGVSYAPDNGEARPASVYVLPTRTLPSSTLPAFTHASVWSIGARYDGEIGDFGLTVAGGWLTMNNKSYSSATTPFIPNSFNVDSDQWNVGAVVYYGNWGFGGSYMDVSDMRNTAGTDSWAADVGLSYWSDGAWSVGVYYLHQEISYNAAIVGPGVGDDEYDGYRLMGQYDLGPGVSVTGALGWDQFEDGGLTQALFNGAVTSTPTYDSKFIGAGLLLSF